MEYQFKLPPFKHQGDIFEDFKDKPAWALFWEQGVGKTKPTIDKTGYLYLKGEVDALVVVAPNGVHRNWITDEVPKHMPDNVLKQTEMYLWESSKAGNKSHKREVDALMKHKGLIILTMSYNAIMTERGRDYLWKMFRQRRVHLVLDESHNIKTPSAKRTKRLIAAGKYPPYKTILTGTPVAQGPFDVYSQVKFLDDFFWHDQRLGTYQAFKTYFGVWIKAEDVKDEWGYDPGYDQLVDFKNIDKLEGMLKKVSSRLTKDDAGLDLPPKLYSKRYVELTKEQKKAYQELVEEFWTELDDGTYIEAALAIVRMMRLQQIICGYVAAEAEQPVVMISDKNPRLDLLKEITDDLPHKAIIWARFTKDIDQIMDMLGDTAVRYDGQVNDDDRAANKEAFQNGDAKFFVANQAAGSTGLTLHAAKTVIYYSNDFNLVNRLQSEDRAHRIGQDRPVHYIDLVAQGTIDEQIVRSLSNKLEIAREIQGDKIKDWI